MFNAKRGSPRRSNRTGREADARRTLPLNRAAWQKLRASVLASEPLCRACRARGLVVPATDVDHISGDPSDNSMENLSPLCHECHSRKTASDHGWNVGYGCDVHGMPLDPNHHWNKR
ncbi:MAG: HNH endonuclease signature motif containing protein [Rhodocyclaceae bacterium]